MNSDCPVKKLRGKTVHQLCLSEQIGYCASLDVHDNIRSYLTRNGNAVIRLSRCKALENKVSPAH